MIRWYDPLAAVLMADLMITVFLNFVMSTSLWNNFLGGFILMVLFDAWTFYCVWRKVKEERRR